GWQSPAWRQLAAARPAIGAPAAPRLLDKNASAKVFAQLAQDYPAGAMAWMHHADWAGPVKVPLDHVEPDMRWMDGADPDHVQDFVQRLKAGKKVKPLLLVKTPSDPLLKLIDGHHRFLAYAEMGLPPRCWIGTVGADHGDWEVMHEYQFHPSAGGAGGTQAALARQLAIWNTAGV
ncbi:MAG: ParB N-terminal domain-containing protein, partial [Streptosporangiaceae bacterium]